MSERIAFVTGVSRGLGAALAAALLARGHAVVGIGRSSAARLAGPAYSFVPVDLADTTAAAAAAAAAFAAAAARRPAQAVLFNNAAVAGPAGTVGDLEPGAVVGAFAVNLVAPFVLADAFVRAFRDLPCDRRLINVSSGAAVRALPGSSAYCAAKAGLEMLTATVAAEQGAGGIVAVTIRPGIIDTDMQLFMRSQAPARLPIVGIFRQFHEQGQLVAADIAAARLAAALVSRPVESGRTYNYDELPADAA
jgi:NAD(P)-dependent dehydrogenase (short-subunit alcohol dehydrogenase family)